MEKVLVVDDEQIARADIIYKVTRSGLNFEWIMEASSAEEALEIIEKNPPDILLTDIVMGEKSGMDLIRAANEQNPGMVSIIICGYPDFAFAQEAISLNVAAYLLKPVSLEDLTGALRKASVLVAKKHNAAYLSVRNQMLREKLKNTELREEITGFLNGFQYRKTAKMAVLFPDDAKYYQVVLLHLNENYAEQDGDEKSEYDLVRYGVRNIVQELGGSYCLSFDNYTECRQVLTILSTPAADLSSAGEELSRLLRRIHETVCEALQVSCDIGASKVTAAISVASLEEAKQALDLRFCFDPAPSGSIYDYSEYDGLETEAEYEQDLKIFQKFLESGDLNNAVRTVQQIMAGIQGRPVLNLRMLYVEMVCILARTCYKKGISIFSFLGSESINGSALDRFGDREEMTEALCSLITTAMNRWVGGLEDTSAVLKKVRDAIEANFSNSELCTNMLAEQFCISAGYLSASYKKAYGINISKHIISLRMEYAEKLLRGTELPIYTISENSGFNNLSYFMRVFKNYHNCTCTQYREQYGTKGE